MIRDKFLVELTKILDVTNYVHLSGLSDTCIYGNVPSVMT
jgi:hypothetical protein